MGNPGNLALPGPDQRWRCGGCGNLTRFDVARSRRTVGVLARRPGRRCTWSRTPRCAARPSRRHLPVVRTFRRDRGRPASRAARRGGLTRRPTWPPNLWDPTAARTTTCRPCPTRSARACCRSRPTCCPQVAGLPPAVRRVADFAPNRRARLGGAAIAGALAGRRASGTGSPSRSLLAPARDDDRVDAAARAWLTRGEGWTDARGARSRPPWASGARAAEREPAELARLRERLEAAEQSLREARAKARAQVEEYKAENATLRRKLGESRSSERQARETAEEALQLAQEARARAATLESAQDKEVRQLRAQCRAARGGAGRPAPRGPADVARRPRRGDHPVPAAARRRHRGGVGAAP